MKEDNKTDNETPESTPQAPAKDSNSTNEPESTPEVISSVPTPTPVSSSDAQDPDKALGIISIVVTLIIPFIGPPIGLIMAIIAKSKSKKAGLKNTLATVGIVLGAVVTVIEFLLAIGIVMVIVLAISAVSAPSKASTDFLNNVTAKNMQTAYSETSQSFQKQYTEQVFSEGLSDVASSGLKLGSIESSSLKTVNGVDTAEITFKATASDGKYLIKFNLVKEGGVWKVSDIRSAKASN